MLTDQLRCLVLVIDSRDDQQKASRSLSSFTPPTSDPHLNQQRSKFDDETSELVVNIFHDLFTRLFAISGCESGGSLGRAGSGQIVKEETIGMRAEKCSDLPFVLSDERQKALELPGQ